MLGAINTLYRKKKLGYSDEIAIHIINLFYTKLMVNLENYF